MNCPHPSLGPAWSPADGLHSCPVNRRPGVGGGKRGGVSGWVGVRGVEVTFEKVGHGRVKIKKIVGARETH